MSPFPRSGRLLCIDCFSGISGDMFLAALLDAGLPLDELTGQLALAGIDGRLLGVCRKKAGAIDACALRVHPPVEHGHRGLSAIRQIIEAGTLAPAVRARALAVFSALAEAEAKVHGIAIEEVHFHEVGAIDALIDIIGAAIGLAWFGIEAIHCAPLPLSYGWVDCAHGHLPLPAPAVCELLRGMPVYGVEGDQELVTPTGAALVRALADSFGPIPPMEIKTVGYGAGSRELKNGRPNLLRLLIGKPLRVAEAQEVEVIETHLDDWSPEGYPYLCERLFALGALDVALSPIQMKKGRPGFALKVLCDKAGAQAIKECLLSETSAIGLRFHTEQRLTLPREHGTVPSPWGPIRVKKILGPAGTILTPEYEDCARLARSRHIPLKELYAFVAAAGPRKFLPETGD